MTFTKMARDMYSIYLNKYQILCTELQNIF